jgi:alanyl-tRNA synthetase
MATERLYYADSYHTAFEASLTSATAVNGAPAAILDRTCFYPTSGGQPHDTGTLGGAAVLDVIVREADGEVLHVLDRALLPGHVCGQVDWARRFDHMQHHTGQHILSQAFERLAGAETVGFHMSPDSITIDLDQPGLAPPIVDAAEDLANQIVTEDRPVRAWFPTEDELAALALRKVPDVEGRFRVVAVEGFDVTACGGTHVARTGAIGLIKVLRTEQRGDILRVEFRCGARALHDYRLKHALLHQMAAELTTGFAELPAALARLRDENKTLRRDLRQAQALALAHEAETLWAAGEPIGGLRLVLADYPDRDAGELRQLVQQVIARPGTVALCAASGTKAQLIAARSDDVALDMVAVLRRGLAVWGIDRGGGRPSFAQGGGGDVSAAEAQAALRAAAEAVRQASESHE